MNQTNTEINKTLNIHWRLDYQVNPLHSAHGVQKLLFEFHFVITCISNHFCYFYYYAYIVITIIKYLYCV